MKIKRAQGLHFPFSRALPYRFLLLPLYILVFPPLQSSASVPSMPKHVLPSSCLLLLLLSGCREVAGPGWTRHKNKQKKMRIGERKGPPAEDSFDLHTGGRRPLKTTLRKDSGYPPLATLDTHLGTVLGRPSPATLRPWGLSWDALLLSKAARPDKGLSAPLRPHRLSANARVNRSGPT